jgi:hypothetical protein
MLSNEGLFGFRNKGMKQTRLRGTTCGNAGMQVGLNKHDPQVVTFPSAGERIVFHQALKTKMKKVVSSAMEWRFGLAWAEVEEVLTPNDSLASLPVLANHSSLQTEIIA